MEIVEIPAIEGVFHLNIFFIINTYIAVTYVPSIPLQYVHSATGVYENVYGVKESLHFYPHSIIIYRKWIIKLVWNNDNKVLNGESSVNYFAQFNKKKGEGKRYLALANDNDLDKFNANSKSNGCLNRNYICIGVLILVLYTTIHCSVSTWFE